MIDFVTQKDETRETYLKKYLQNVERDWLQLSENELKLISNHMMESDYPETMETINCLAQKNGLELANSFDQYDDETKIVVFKHSNSTAIV